jgi:ankyrin repeat protein
MSIAPNYLYSLIRKNDLESIEKAILNREIDLQQFAYNDVCSDGNGIHTPLEKAVTLGNIKIVRVLLDLLRKFPDACCLSYYTHKALPWAFYYNHTTLIEMLWAEVEPDYKHIGELCDFVILDAVYGKHESMVLKLLSQGANVNCINIERARTPLMAAAETNNVSMMQLLISGCDINGRFKGGITPLNYATMQGNFETIKVLVEAGADVDLCDDRGRTALLWAVYYELQEIIDYLTPLASQEIKNKIEEQSIDKLALDTYMTEALGLVQFDL